jgi:hypothetical protein
MDTFDEMESLFTTLGLSEGAAKVAATGRLYRNEADARAQYAADEGAALADSLIERRARGEQILESSRPANEAADLTGLPQPVTEVVSAAREALGMTPADAKDMAVRLYARENARGGKDHADLYTCTFAAGLRRPVREAAPR